MKSILLPIAIIGAVMLTGCKNETENNFMDKWEYKTIHVEAYPMLQGEENKNINLKLPLRFCSDELNDSLNTAGQEGWELVNAIPEVETAYPQLDFDEYNINGIKSNVRTSGLSLIFKRKIR